MPYYSKDSGSPRREICQQRNRNCSSRPASDIGGRDTERGSRAQTWCQKKAAMVLVEGGGMLRLKRLQSQSLCYAEEHSFSLFFFSRSALPS